MMTVALRKDNENGGKKETTPIISNARPCCEIKPEQSKKGVKETLLWMGAILVVRHAFASPSYPSDYFRHIPFF